VFREVGAALLHLDQHDGLPHQVCKRSAAAILLDPILAGGAGFLQPGMAEGAEQVVEKELRLALFVAADVLAAPGDESG
jgi:hypothetical protein